MLDALVNVAGSLLLLAGLAWIDAAIVAVGRHT